jgi:hypothetical protein
MVNMFMLGVAFSDCYSEFPYAEYIDDEYTYTACSYAEYNNAVCHYAECFRVIQTAHTITGQIMTHNSNAKCRNL